MELIVTPCMSKNQTNKCLLHCIFCVDHFLVQVRSVFSCVCGVKHIKWNQAQLTIKKLHNLKSNLLKHANETLAWNLRWKDENYLPVRKKSTRSKFKQSMRLCPVNGMQLAWQVESFLLYLWRCLPHIIASIYIAH